MKKIGLMALSFSLILGLNANVLATEGNTIQEGAEVTTETNQVETSSFVKPESDVVYSLEEAPEMKYTKEIGGVVFSNYLNHNERKATNSLGEEITIYEVRIGLNGCMKSEVDGTEFINFMSLPFNSVNGVYLKEFGKIEDPSVDYNFYKTGVPALIDSEKDTFSYLSKKGVKAYAPERNEDGTYPAGLTWEFDLANSDFYNVGKGFRTTQFIRVNQGNNVYYYAVTIANDNSYLIEVATPTDSTIYVNGEVVSFDAYNINSNNYFKLRDVAHVLRKTEKKFEVQWNPSVTTQVNGETVRGAIDLFSNITYTIVGGEMKLGDGKVKDAVLTNSPILKDGVLVSSPDDQKLTGYNINGNNYFKLRDLGQLFDFNVSWDGELNSIIINTAESYDPSN